MSKRAKHSALEGALDPRLLAGMRLFAGVALAISIYLAWVALGGAVAGCGPESGCDRVLHSRWSKWLGLPVGFFAVGLYGGLLGLTFGLGPDKPAAQQRRAWAWLVPGAVLIIGSVMWFAGLQWLVIKQVCPFCMTVHGCGLLAAALILLSAPFRSAPAKPWQIEKQVFVAPAVAKKLACAGLAGVAVLVAGQVMFEPKMFASRGVGRASLEAAARRLEIYEGKFQFDLKEVPLIGSPQASNAMVSLFDYTCHYCREMHRHLMAAHQTFSNRLAIVSLPMPLDSRCNPNVKVTPPPHTNACEYARLGLAVWRARPQVHAQFEEWIFAPATPPELSQARDYAARLVGGTNVLFAALRDPWIDRQLRQDIALYTTNYVRFRNGAMPQLIIGTNLTSGRLNGVSDLYRLLAEQLALRAGPAAAPQTASPLPRPAG